MSSVFTSVQIPKIRKSVHDLSYENKLSFDMGDLVPVYHEDVVPGDRFRVNSEVFLRFAPMLAPIMHRVNCYVHYFFVPYRLIWDDWKEFITGGEDGLSQPVFPRFKFFAESVKAGSLCDYLGYNFAAVNPQGTAQSAGEYSLLPLRAYQMIYNEYYRDQNLIPEVQISHASGNSSSADVLVNGTDYATFGEAYNQLTKLRKRAWEKDYFTSALPFLQRGVAAQIPFGEATLGLSPTGQINALLDVYQRDSTPNSSTWQRVISGKNNQTTGSDLANGLDFDQQAKVAYSYHWKNDGTSVTKTPTGTSSNLMAAGEGYKMQQDGILSDINLNGTHAVSVRQLLDRLQISGLTAPTINELRLSNHIQKWLELNARVGSRYIEQILGHYGVRVPDYRLDRPEYLGGGKSPVQISEVLQTSSTDDVTPQGNMSGHAYSVGNKNSFKYTFDEHGIVLGIMSVLPRTSYYQGISRFLTKFDKFDHYFPEFAHLSEQAVKNEEVFCKFQDENYNKSDFGYQERFAEYKSRYGECHGDFRTTLDYWHMSRKFDNEPSLNASFVESNPTDRIWNVTEGQHLWCQVYNSVAAVRPIPKHSIPSL